MLHRWTASASDRVVACTGSLNVEHDERPPGPEAVRGTAVHYYIEQLSCCASESVAWTRTSEKYPDVKNLRNWCKNIELNDFYEFVGVGVASGTTEIKFAYNPITFESHIIQTEAQRDYGLVGEDHIVGTADVVAVLGDHIVVIDWKTGKWIKNPADLWQMKVLSVMAAEYFEKDKVRAIIAPVNTKGLRQDKLEVAEFDVFDLLSFKDTLRRKMLEARTGGEFNFGIDQCRFCPGQGHCEVYKKFSAT